MSERTFSAKNLHFPLNNNEIFHLYARALFFGCYYYNNIIRLLRSQRQQRRRKTRFRRSVSEEKDANFFFININIMSYTYCVRREREGDGKHYTQFCYFERKSIRVQFLFQVQSAYNQFVHTHQHLFSYSLGILI